MSEISQALRLISSVSAARARSFSSVASPLKMEVLVLVPEQKLPESILAQQAHEAALAKEKQESFQFFVSRLMSGDDKVRWNPESKQAVGP